MDGAVIGEGGLGVGALQEPTDTVRGYRARRYLGDASLWGNSTCGCGSRTSPSSCPGSGGSTASPTSAVSGSRASRASRPGYGGGLWLSLLRDRMGFSVGLAHSVEDDIVYFKGGFSY